MNKKILIIGSGISGLYLGYLLKKEGFSIKILEANNRIGGRIFTKNSHHTNVELGATWLWGYNSELLKLCKQLGISLFEQNMDGDALFEAVKNNVPQRFQIPTNQEISYRIVGGTVAILNKLKATFTKDEIDLTQKVLQIEDHKTAIKVITETKSYIADVVVSTIPPQLLVNTVHFSPKLVSELTKIADNTHTWMKDSIKFALVYKAPFWRELGLSGVGFSNVGPFTEIYDHSDFENNHFALMGFLNSNLANETKLFREEKIREQLFHFFGTEGQKYLFYEEKVWSKDTLLNFKKDTFIPPHFNNGHAIYQQEFLNGKFIIAGSETSPNFGGYMEGAVFRGIQVLKQLKNKFP
jgi:monoamine oxidase